MQQITPQASITPPHTTHHRHTTSQLIRDERWWTSDDERRVQYTLALACWTCTPNDARWLLAVIDSWQFLAGNSELFT
jgi:hypothetical protein